jgi:hypothetical protein
MQRANVHSARLILNWGVVERRRGHYDWAAYDGLVLRAARAKVRLLPILLSSPPWVCNPSCARHIQQWPPVRAADRERFNAFAREAVARYGPNGTFSVANGLPKAYRAKWFQVWNEPNIPNYWNDRSDATAYGRFLRAAGRSIKRADPEARVLAAGVPEPSSRRAEVISIYPFLETMFDVLISPRSSTPWRCTPTRETTPASSTVSTPPGARCATRPGRRTSRCS